MEIGQTGVPFSIRGSIRFVRQEEVEDESKYAAGALAENQNPGKPINISGTSIDRLHIFRRGIVPRDQ